MQNVMCLGAGPGALVQIMSCSNNSSNTPLSLSAYIYISMCITATQAIISLFVSSFCK